MQVLYGESTTKFLSIQAQDFIEDETIETRGGKNGNS